MQKERNQPMGLRPTQKSISKAIKVKDVICNFLSSYTGMGLFILPCAV